MKRFLVTLMLVGVGIVSATANAITLTPNDVAAHMAEPGHVSIVLHARQLFDDNKLAPLKAYLSSQPELLQEEILTILSRRAFDFSRMTSEREAFLTTISQQQPKYMVRSQGDGFWATMPAFNYAGEAKWVLNHWQIHQLQAQALQLLAADQLSLASWLAFSSPDYPLHRQAVLDAIPSMEPAALTKLETVYLNDKNMVWVPDNAILAALIEHTQSEVLYQLLWLRRTDSYSLNALLKLSSPPVTPAAITQMMAATSNPVLTNSANRQLAQLHPMPETVKAFMLKQLGNRSIGNDVAVMLAQHGHKVWLTELAKTTSGVTRRNIEKGLKTLTQ
ncbi:hypothetical protein [Enterovibrio nigricans]|uniref:Uncharacterized protein n=1 Tax=Enterovibrio nigricans DSM 22720 TaxID=1121868 RepID=A0A1T4V184_9GAMM|nr:hypothetical protein [Enterovibrio nigricans]PKF50571.1 hypothetical protein AT251_10615 [Enterovibrio nigricans]SKA58686.1 hypothetical protein SAMN02745132_03020 [Enterovibrio nigricans DSM 22720]